MLLNAQQLALEILSNMCCPDGKIAVEVVLKKLFIELVHYILVPQFYGRILPRTSEVSDLNMFLSYTNNFRCSLCAKMTSHMCQ